MRDEETEKDWYRFPSHHCSAEHKGKQGADFRASGAKFRALGADFRAISAEFRAISAEFRGKVQNSEEKVQNSEDLGRIPSQNLEYSI